MSFIAEFCVRIPPLRDASETVPEMQISGEDIILADGSPRKFVFTARGADFDAFGQALRADPTVSAFTVLEQFPDAAYYIVTYAEDATLEGTYHVALEHDILYTDIDLRDGEYSVRARVPDRDALTALREHCRANDIPFRLERLYREETDGDATVLTGPQAEAINCAYDQGYFDTPRQTTLDRIATELGISRQALADRLRRGYKRLIETHVVD